MAAREGEKVRYEPERCKDTGGAGKEADLQTGWFDLLMKGCGSLGRTLSRLGVGARAECLLQNSFYETVYLNELV
ncbi:MAG: hypothetical protein SWQ30_01000 [Thermodesulfobacteriota bacterium]|nr:hypothetical protein [Thermodesulfobacteriota bacterium]